MYATCGNGETNTDATYDAVDEYGDSREDIYDTIEDDALPGVIVNGVVVDTAASADNIYDTCDNYYTSTDGADDVERGVYVDI